MRRGSLAAFLVLVLWPLAPLWIPPAFAADRVRLALPAKSMGYLPLFVALHRGFFKADGIAIETPMMLPQLAHNALLSGEIDYHGVADSALRLAARGAPLKSIFFGATRPNYFLLAKPESNRCANCAASTSAWLALVIPSNWPAASRSIGNAWICNATRYRS
jgi:ABC-type nitrate/sulfonate/bicarbonate transport system substrate-binding protein